MTMDHDPWSSTIRSGIVRYPNLTNQWASDIMGNDTSLVYVFDSFNVVITTGKINFIGESTVYRLRKFKSTFQKFNR